MAEWSRSHLHHTEYKRDDAEIVRQGEIDRAIVGCARERRIDRMIQTIQTELPDTNEFSAYDARRLAILQGLRIADAIINRVAVQQDRSLATRISSNNLPGDIKGIERFSALSGAGKRQIVSAQQLMGQLRTEAHKHADELHRRMLGGEQLTLRDKVGMSDAVEDEYEWMVRQIGFDRALSAFGLSIDEEGQLTTTSPLGAAEFINEVRELPTLADFKAERVRDAWAAERTVPPTPRSFEELPNSEKVQALLSIVSRPMDRELVFELAGIEAGALTESDRASIDALLDGPGIEKTVTDGKETFLMTEEGKKSLSDDIDVASVRRHYVASLRNVGWGK